MTGRLAWGLAGLAGLVLVHCGPSASGTKTNWFRECDEDADCGQELHCACGVCTLTCTEDAACAEGLCSTELQSSVQCGMATPERICLPASEETCSEYPVEAEDTLGDARLPSCTSEGALVCEAFDRPFYPEYATWYQGGMSAAVQDCETARGDGALHYVSQAEGVAQTRIRLPEGVSTGPLHARFFVRLSSEMVLPEQVQIFELWDREGSEVPDRIGVLLTAEGAPRVYVGASDTTLESASPEPLPRDTWLCVELALDVQSENGSASLSVNGTEVLTGTGLSTQPEAPIGVVVIEAQPSSDTRGVDLFLDELVVATAPIGCDG